MTNNTRNVRGCIFCDIINGRAPSHWIYEDKHVAAFLSLEGHPLVVTKPHFSDVVELDKAHAAAIMNTAVRLAKATKNATGCDGINLVQSNGAAAGQDVFHFHLHIKPRFIGDDVKLHWNTKTLDEAARRETSDLISRQLKKLA
ncbi:MAG: HIT domain-containing protein [Epibacterium sp.]|nr:HIT domain-containing protein [Epibacterium sp.]NQX72655.1 HIT domain-containing protein [Epibacterium sp.]